tara:strand:- start:588 stop:1265 length:678 start_codon:yes stop_codon:yes gene_type:complete
MNPIKHVAIIMDGNGRWGLKHKKSRNYGHRAGLKTVEKIIKISIKKKIPYLTLFAFSTENWKRPQKEINFLLKLLENFLQTKLNQLIEQKIKLKIIGDKNKFPKRIKKIINYSENKTKKNKKLHINLAINYGSKSEIVESIKRIIKKKQSVSEKKITSNLYTSETPDPEILIRTGNTKRLSNFLLWQLAYSEIFFEKKLWPDFKENDYLKILNKFKIIKRNFGRI